MNIIWLALTLAILWREKVWVVYNSQLSKKNRRLIYIVLSRVNEPVLEVGCALYADLKAYPNGT